MKKTISAASLLLAVLMIAMCCVGCGDSKSDSSADTGSIVGKWSYTLDYDTILDTAMGQTLADADDQQKAYMESLLEAFEGVSLTLWMDFKADGTYSLSADEAELTSAMDSVKAKLKEKLPEMLAALGMSSEDMESQLSQAGYTMDSYVDLLLSQMDTTSMIEQMKKGGVYLLEGDKLYVSSDDNNEIDKTSYVVVSISGSTMKVTEVVSDDDSSTAFPKELLPLTLTKE